MHIKHNFYVRTPALSREAPRSVSMRGGPLGSIWGRFGGGFGGVLRGFGEAFGRIWELKFENPSKRKRMERFTIKFKSMLFTGGGRCLREAVSIRPPPGRRRVRSVLAVPSDRRRSLSGVRGSRRGHALFFIWGLNFLQNASKTL